MTIRLFGAPSVLLCCTLSFLCAASTLATAQQGLTARTDINRGVYQAPAGIGATTVESSKSNTSDRMGGGGGGKGAAGVTTVKSSKSNTSNRMGGGAGGKGAVQLNPQPEPPGRR